jgi:hypothetical protein
MPAELALMMETEILFTTNSFIELSQLTNCPPGIYFAGSKIINNWPLKM